MVKYRHCRKIVLYSAAHSSSDSSHIPEIPEIAEYGVCSNSKHNRVLQSITDMSLKIVVVMELCPAAFVTRRMKKLQALRYVLESDIVSVSKVPEGYLCTYENDVRPAVVFDKEPTVEYHKELFDAPRDWSNHVAVVEDVMIRMVHD